MPRPRARGTGADRPHLAGRPVRTRLASCAAAVLYADARRRASNPHAGVTMMDTILVVNSGSSSLKFQVFEIAGPATLKRLVKGQLDGIGTQPRLRVKGSTMRS